MIKDGNKKSLRRNGYLNGNSNFRSWATAWFQSAVGFRTKNIGMSCNDHQSDKILKKNESIVDLGIEVLLLTCNTVANAGTSQSITEPCHAAIPVMQFFQTSRAESCIHQLHQSCCLRYPSKRKVITSSMRKTAEITPPKKKTGMGQICYCNPPLSGCFHTKNGKFRGLYHGQSGWATHYKVDPIWLARFPTRFPYDHHSSYTNPYITLKKKNL